MYVRTNVIFVLKHFAKLYEVIFLGILYSWSFSIYCLDKVYDQ